MELEQNISRALIYGFLASMFTYPQENWTEDVPLLVENVVTLTECSDWLVIPPVSLTQLQAAHRHTFGLVGSLCYETEYGLPHEYQQSQQMADVAGFYRAFGFALGQAVRERPDHVAVELEFMHVLALKEAYAWQAGQPEHVAICVDAQQKFLQDHLGRWFDLFTQGVTHNAPDSVYALAAQLAAVFVRADAERLGVALARPRLTDVQHTPFDPDFSCATCTLPGQNIIPLSTLS
ncbi:MAG: molecular chaperone TorD family protein [Chloroflexi bacterium]|nr:molecular chaperone TorD family protein [Chloroflexota bacterium]MBP8057717.1 molecular chaperone TorD family protein [Chloroflexota bacterium]